MQFEPRKMDFGDIIDSSVKLFTKNFVPLVIIIAIFYGPMLFVNHFIDSVISDKFLGDNFIENITQSFESATDSDSNAQIFDEFFADDQNVRLIIFSQIIFFIFSLIAPIGTLSGLNYISDRIHDKQPGIGEVIKSGLKRYPTYLFASILVGIIVIVIISPFIIAFVYLLFNNNLMGAMSLFFLAFLPFIIFMLLLFAYTNIMTCVIAIEKITIIKALTRSLRLIRGFYWKTIGILILITIIISVITIFFSQIGQSIGGTIAHENMRLAVIASIGTLFSIIFQPVMLCVVYLIYLDIRIRKENYDIEILTSKSMEFANTDTQPGTSD